MRLLAFLVAILIFFYLPNQVFASGIPVQSNSSYTTPSSPAASDGTSTETVKIHLQDASQEKVGGAVITLSSSNNTTAKFPQNDQTTDSNGDATFTVTSTSPGTTKITLFDSTNNVTFTDWFSITFYDASKGCLNVPSAPVLTNAVSNTDNNVTLTWTNSPDPVTNYLVSFGIESGKYIYGDPNVGSQGTKSFTVGSLAGNKKYYFVVAANNNCGRSGFSNEIATIVKPIPQTPSPSPKPTVNPITSTPNPNSLSTPITAYLATDSPEPTLVPQGSQTTDSKILIRKWGIGIISSGVLLILVAFIAQKIKERNQIRMLGEINIPEIAETDNSKELENSPPQTPLPQ